jgi:uncharacterized protein (TIGR02996 family)
VTRHGKDMHPERLSFLRAINAAPRDRTIQLAFADWLQERGEAQAERFWRNGLGGRVGLGGLVGRVGLGGLVGLGGRGGRGGLVGRGGRVLNPENPIVLIPGENALVFMPHGYGFAVFVGAVAAEYPSGWIMDPARTVEQINPNDSGDARWVELAGGKDQKLRSRCRYGPPITDGVRVPLGCLSLKWQGDLPE